MKIKLGILFLAVTLGLIFCTKKQGTNPSLAFNDASLLDSCKQSNYVYYKNDPSTLLSGAAGPHGTFKLRFNAIAYAALTENGKLPLGKKFPEGSLLVKDVYSGGVLDLYAFMYKKSGSWLWAEIKPSGQVLYSVTKNPGVCTGCHSQNGNRDLAVSFNFY